MFCPKCEINYHQSIKECVNCGSKLVPGIICMECGTRNEENAKVCNLCGKVLVTKIKSKEKSKKQDEKLLKNDYERVCPYGHYNDPNNIFCSTCGEFLEWQKKEDIETITQPSWFRATFNFITSLF